VYGGHVVRAVDPRRCDAPVAQDEAFELAAVAQVDAVSAQDL